MQPPRNQRLLSFAMPNHRRVAAKALATHLQGQTEPVELFSLACVADRAAREVGRKKDLFDSLWDYPQLLPKGWVTSWLTTGSGTTSLAHAVPVGWKPGSAVAGRLSMDPGILRTATHDEVVGAFN